MFDTEDRSHILKVAWLFLLTAAILYDFIAYFGISKQSISRVVLNIFLVFAVLDIIFVIATAFLVKISIKSDKTLRILFIWIINYSVVLLGFIICFFSNKFYYTVFFSFPSIVLFLIYNPWYFKPCDKD